MITPAKYRINIIKINPITIAIKILAMIISLEFLISLSYCPYLSMLSPAEIYFINAGSFGKHIFWNFPV